MTTLTRTLLTIAAGAVLGLGGGWLLWRPNAAPVETYATPIRQGDSSLVLERKPDVHAKPAQKIPKGSTVERVVQVTIQPRPVPAGTIRPVYAANGDSDATKTPIPETIAPKYAQLGDSLICPPVRVDLSLVKLQDQTRRVIASSPDGTVTGGIDIPVAPSVSMKQFKWAAGGLYNPRDRTYGGFLDRDLGPLRIGVEAMQQRVDVMRQSVAVQVRVGLRF